MKPRNFILVIVALFSMTTLFGQSRITVEASSYDISYNLDLEAVATLFGEVDNLEEFEIRLNDPRNEISNLDLNNDGFIDYLRVIETQEKNVNVVVVQAVLERDIYQDVATIVVDQQRRSNVSVQIIGSPYLYGVNYIIEPVYVWTPPIYKVFRSRRYVVWHSPYYWGYYPSYYHYRSPAPVNIYVRNVYNCVNHKHHYRYTNTVYSNRGVTMYQSVSRNDYGTRHPENSFSRRNTTVSNSRELRSATSPSSSSSRSAAAVNSTNSSTRRSDAVNSRSSSTPVRTSDTVNRSNSSNPTRVTRETGTSSASSSNRSSSTTSSRSNNTVNRNDSKTTPSRNSSTTSGSNNSSRRASESGTVKNNTSSEKSGTKIEVNSNRSNRSSGNVGRSSSNSSSSTRSGQSTSERSSKSDNSSNASSRSSSSSRSR